MRQWLPLVILASAQFVIVLDERDLVSGFVRKALLALALLGVASFWFTRQLPARASLATTGAP